MIEAKFELTIRLLQMRKRGAATSSLATSTFQSLIMLITNRKPSNLFLPLLKDLRQIYGEYNLAIAEYVPSVLHLWERGANGRNDGLKLRAISMGQALSHGQTVLKANKRMEWIMSMGEAPPKILWARIAQVHEDTEVAQVAVRFDSHQVSLQLHALSYRAFEGGRY